MREGCSCQAEGTTGQRGGAAFDRTPPPAPAHTHTHTHPGRGAVEPPGQRGKALAHRRHARLLPARQHDVQEELDRVDYEGRVGPAQRHEGVPHGRRRKARKLDHRRAGGGGYAERFVSTAPTFAGASRARLGADVEARMGWGGGQAGGGAGGGGGPCAALETPGGLQGRTQALKNINSCCRGAPSAPNNWQRSSCEAGALLLGCIGM